MRKNINLVLIICFGVISTLIYRSCINTKERVNEVKTVACDSIQSKEIDYTVEDKHNQTLKNVALALSATDSIMEDAQPVKKSIPQDQKKQSTKPQQKAIPVDSVKPIVYKKHLEFKTPTFIREYQRESLPKHVNPNFDNYLIKDTLLAEQVDSLKLWKLNKTEGTVFGINYLVHISRFYKSVIVTYLPAEHEMYTALVNYDANSDIIDYQIVAYDNSKDKKLRKSSVLNKKYVEVYNKVQQADTLKRKEEYEVRIYKFTELGEIKISH